VVVMGTTNYRYSCSLGNHLGRESLHSLPALGRQTMFPSHTVYGATIPGTVGPAPSAPPALPITTQSASRLSYAPEPRGSFGHSHSSPMAFATPSASCVYNNVRSTNHHVFEVTIAMKVTKGCLV